MLKRNLITVLTTTAVIGFGVAMNANATSINGSANVTIISPMTLTETAAMNFANVAPDSAVATTVVLDTADGVTSPGAVKAGMSGTPSSGHFSVGGLSGANYAITLPAAPITVSGTMTLDTFTSLSASTGAAGSGTLGATGDTFSVGATLNVPANQAAGAYSVFYGVTVNYN